MKRLLPVVLAFGCATERPAPAPTEIVGSPPAPTTTVETDPAAPRGAPPAVAYVPLSEPEERVVTDPSRATRVPGMSRKRISLDVRDADVHNVLRFLAQEGGVNIVVDQSVSGRVTMRLRNVTVEDAFLTVLDSLSLGFTHRGEIVRIAAPSSGG